MKKLIAIAVVLALVAGVAFAQTANGISVNAWGRGAFAPLVNVGPAQVNGEADPDDKGESYAGTGITWGGPKPRVDFRVNGNSDYVGFNLQYEGEGISVADFASIWVKPFSSDILKLTVGSKFQEDTLRGKVGDLNGGFGDFVLGGVPDEDAIFARFAAGGSTKGNADPGDSAFMISSAPIDGLFIGLFVPGPLWNWNGPSTGSKAAISYQYMQLGFGYNIANIGHIRAQYIGGWSGAKDLSKEDDVKYFTVASDTGKLASIELAFALTAVQGLVVDLGARIGLPLEVKDTAGVSTFYSKGTNIGLGATFNAAPFGIGAHVAISGLGAYAGGRGKDAKSESGATTQVHLVPSFDVGEATIALDLRLALGGKSKDPDGKDVDKSDWSQIGFGAYVQKGLGSGSVKAGVSYTLPKTNGEGKADGSGVFSIPIILEYAFF